MPKNKPTGSNSIESAYLQLSKQEQLNQRYDDLIDLSQGAGLELAMAYDLVKAHGRELLAKRAEAKETPFTLQRPM